MAKNHHAVDERAMDDIVRDGHLRSTVPKSRFYQLQRDIEDGKAAVNGGLRDSYVEDMKGVRAGVAVSRAFDVLAVVTTGYSIYADVHYNHESVAHATTTNVAGTGMGVLATIGTSAAVGALFGSEFPVVGTVVGAALGAVVGGAVCVFTSGMVDSLWNGSGVGDALTDGGKAVADAGEAIGHGVEDVGSAIGHGLSKAWSSIF